MSSDETELTRAPPAPEADSNGPSVDAQIEERGLSLLRDRRRLVAGVLAFVLLLVAVYVVVPKVVGLDDALERIDDGEAVWIAAAIVANVLAFGAYVMLFRGILGSDTTPRSNAGSASRRRTRSRWRASRPRACSPPPGSVASCSRTGRSTRPA